MNRKNLFLAAATLLIFWSGAAAQDEESFDLSSQRGEIQEFNPVTGHKIDHKGLIINPTPQSIQYPYAGNIDTSCGFTVKDKKHKFASDLEFIRQAPKGLPLIIDFGRKQATKAGVKNVSGAYLLDIGPKEIKITGYDERGAFYGLQTLRQILASDIAAGNEIPMMVINDFPSMKYRGVVEGFYGTPWSHQVRLSLIDFYGQNKMNDYLYGPKDDPYHSSPYWRQPYPEDQARNIKELVNAAKRNRVNFIWAIHPGKDIRWNKADYDSLVNKFNMMYDLGVRSFAIFFDDIEGEGTNPQKQVELLNDLSVDFVKAKGDVTNLIVCPTDYSQLWAKPGPDGALAVYGRGLNPDVEVFWTGAVVCSDLTHETLDFINSRINRPALYWWNYPVSDYCKHIILQGPVYGLATDLTDAEVAGIESNPMEHGEASKLALYGVADYAWNTPAYNAIDNWERGIAYLVPDAADAYRTFAIHSADTETGYRRDESWETVTFPYNSYTTQQFNDLKAEFEKTVTVEDRMNKGCSNKALLKELSPWLSQLTKVGERGLRTLELIKLYESGNDSMFWTHYVANIMSAEDKAGYEAHKIGTMKLHPFYEQNMDNMISDFYTRISGKKAAMYKGIGSYPNLRTTQQKLMLDNDTTTFYTSANSQGADDWIGLDLGELRPVNEVIVHQGRNSTDDVDYFDNVRLEYSADGHTWTPLTETLARTYIITWNGTPVNARYVRIHRMDSDRKNWASVRSFRVNPPSAERIGLNITAADPQSALLAFDSNPTSTFATSHSLAFDRKPGTSELIVLASDIPEAQLTQLDAIGHELMRTTVNGKFAKIKLAPETARLVLHVMDHDVIINEIIQR